MRRIALITSAVLVTTGACAPAAQDTEVFVIGALGTLHDREESFSFATLDRIVRAVRADVLLLEVTPEELAGRQDTRGRPEYPRVIWPLLAERDAPAAFAMEAGQPLYGELVRDAEAIWSSFAAERPEDNATLAAFTESMTEMQLAYWKSAADTQDETTDALARARHELRAALLPAGGVFQQRWDRVMLDVATRVIAEHPGKRVLVIGSFRNRFTFVEELGKAPGVTVVDVDAWLTAGGFGLGTPPG